MCAQVNPINLLIRQRVGATYASSARLNIVLIQIQNVPLASGCQFFEGDSNSQGFSVMPLCEKLSTVLRSTLALF